MVYLKAMKGLKKFLVAFFALLPFSAGAVAPFVVGLIGSGIVIAGFSIYRSMAPVNMADALSFFSSCWTCQLFSDIMLTMSEMLPKVYSSLGSIMFPLAVVLSTIWFAWLVFSGYVNAKPSDAWDLTSKFGTHLLKLMVVGAVLFAPLPRIITDAVVDPVFTMGFSISKVISDESDYTKCMVATAIADPVALNSDFAKQGAFSPKVRHSLACEIANVHQITGLGMTVGWTILNMAFNEQYMHKILWGIPIFPNVILILVGGLILGLFIYALLPIPLYFLEVFMVLALDIIMLPFMLLSWLFKDWTFIKSGKTIPAMINDLIKGVVGIALVSIFLIFAVMFLNAAFGSWEGASVLQQAIDQNDSHILMDGLMFNNDSLIVVVLMGLFITMFMTMIPELIKTIFNIEVPKGYFETAKKNANTLWNNAKKWYKTLKK